LASPRFAQVRAKNRQADATAARLLEWRKRDVFDALRKYDISVSVGETDDVEISANCQKGFHRAGDAPVRSPSAENQFTWVKSAWTKRNVTMLSQLPAAAGNLFISVHTSFNAQDF